MDCKNEWTSKRDIGQCYTEVKLPFMLLINWMSPKVCFTPFQVPMQSTTVRVQPFVIAHLSWLNANMASETR